TGRLGLDTASVGDTRFKEVDHRLDHVVAPTPGAEAGVRLSRGQDGFVHSLHSLHGAGFVAAPDPLQSMQRIRRANVPISGATARDATTAILQTCTSLHQRNPLQYASGGGRVKILVLNTGSSSLKYSLFESQ